MTRNIGIMLALAALSVASCDRALIRPQESRMHEASFTAVLPDGFSKVGGTDEWTGDGSEKVWFCITQDDARSYGEYLVDDVSGSTSAVTPAYWQSKTVDAVVTAFYPYSLVGGSVDISDQSTEEKFKACDFLCARMTGVKFGNAVNVNFTHACAKIRLELTAGSGIDLSEITSVRVLSSLYATCNDGVLGGYSNGYIKACRESDTAYEALVIPGRVNPTQFVLIDINGGKYAGGRTFAYSPPASPERTLAAGDCYTYSITVGEL